MACAEERLVGSHRRSGGVSGTRRCRQRRASAFPTWRLHPAAATVPNGMRVATDERAKSTGPRAEWHLHPLMSMTRSALVVGIWLASSSAMANDAVLDVRLDGYLMSAPGAVQVTIFVRRDDDHRSLTIEADSESFYRSSSIALDGARAPRRHSVWYRDLPEGKYEIRVRLDGVSRTVAISRRHAEVIGNPGDEMRTGAATRWPPGRSSPSRLERPELAPRADEPLARCADVRSQFARSHKAGRLMAAASGQVLEGVNESADRP